MELRLSGMGPLFFFPKENAVPSEMLSASQPFPIIFIRHNNLEIHLQWGTFPIRKIGCKSYRLWEDLKQWDGLQASHGSFSLTLLIYSQAFMCFFSVIILEMME